MSPVAIGIRRPRVGVAPRSPRILHLTADLYTRASGVRTCLLALGRAQRALGCGVSAHCVDLPTPGDDLVGDELPFPISASPALLRAPIYLSPAAERWARSRAAAGFDLLHQHGIWSALSRATIGWRKAHGRPTVIAPHGALAPLPLGYSPRKKALALRWYERENLAQASCLHATAESEVDGIRDFGLRNPVAVIPNGGPEPGALSGGDAQRFRAAHGIPADARLLLFLSRVHPVKGLHGAVEALAGLAGQLGPWQLVIAGPEEDPAYCASIRAFVARHGLGPRVRWVGPLYGDAKRDALAAAELFVLPTLSDSYAIVVAEALSAGVPVVTTRAAQPWQVLEARGCGWWVPPGPAGVAAALAQATTLPPSELARMGWRGMAVAGEQCRWSDAAVRTLLLYRWLMGDAGPPDFVAMR